MAMDIITLSINNPPIPAKLAPKSLLLSMDISPSHLSYLLLSHD